MRIHPRDSKGLSIPIVVLVITIVGTIATFTVERLLKQNMEAKEINKKLNYEKVFVLAAQILQARWESGDYNPAASQDSERRAKESLSSCTQCNPWYFKSYMNNCLGTAGAGLGRLTLDVDGDTYIVNVELIENPTAENFPTLRQSAYASIANTLVSVDPRPKTGVFLKLTLELRVDHRTAAGTRFYTQYVVLQDTCNEIYVTPTTHNEEGGNASARGYCVTTTCAPPSTGKRFMHGFYIDRFEVTTAQYKLCREAGGCGIGMPDPQPNFFADYYTYDPNTAARPYYNSPMMVGNPAQAQQYCNWLGKRLPTAHEWRYAARGEGGNRKYAWPDQIGLNTPTDSFGVFNDPTGSGASAVIDDGAACAGDDVCDTTSCSAAEGSICNGNVCHNGDYGDVQSASSNFDTPPTMPSSVCTRDGNGTINGLTGVDEEDGRGVFGTYNQSGNVAEWVIDTTDDTAKVMGGSWRVDIDADDSFIELDVVKTLAEYTGSPWGDISDSIGWRCVRNCDAAWVGESCTNDSDCCSGWCNGGSCGKMEVGAQCIQDSDCCADYNDCTTAAPAGACEAHLGVGGSAFISTCAIP